MDEFKSPEKPRQEREPTNAEQEAINRLLLVAEAKKREIQLAREAEEREHLNVPNVPSIGQVLASKMEWKTPKWIECPECKESYSRLSPSGICDNCQVRKDNDQNRQQGVKNRILDLFGPGGMERCQIDNYKAKKGNSDALTIARTFDPYFQNLFLYGPSGSGKTFLAEIICVRMIQMGLSVEFKESRQLIGEVPAYSEIEARPIIERYSRAKVLVIDELGLSDSTEWATDTLGRLLNLRARINPYGLIVTSNLGFEDLQRKFGNQRITSRLNGMCQVVHIKPVDEKGKPIDFRGI